MAVTVTSNNLKKRLDVGKREALQNVDKNRKLLDMSGWIFGLPADQPKMLFERTITLYQLG